MKVKVATAVRDPVEEDDRVLIARVRGGDRFAFDEVMRRHERWIFHLALRTVGDVDEAKDVAQRAFLQAFRRVETFRGEASFRTWLYRIAWNLAQTALRENGRASRVAALAVGPSESAPPNTDGERVRAAVRKLPPKQRLVVELRAFDELSFREVADIAECSEDAAKMNFYHAMKKLRELLGEGDDK